jgi:hypothetical protein
MYDAAAASLRWKAAGMGGQGDAAGLAIVQRLRGLKVMVAYRWGEGRHAGMWVWLVCP